jgi:hypothetical protein
METFKEYYFLQNSTYKEHVSKQNAFKDYRKNRRKKESQSYKGYNKYEALTVNGDDLHYIKSICEGENSSDFFVVSLTNNFKTKAWYDWYTKEELEKTFTRLNKSIFTFMNKELDRI